MTKNTGFTVIETLLVIAIISIIAASTIPIASGFLVRNQLKNKVNETMSSLSIARTNAMSGKEDSQWGVNVSDTNIVMYKGASYASRDSEFDETYKIPSSVTVSQDEVIFDKLSGNPNAATSITFTSNAGDSRSISINEVGTISIN